MKRLLILMAALLIAGAVPTFAAQTGDQLDDCIHIRIGNIYASPGEDIYVPVSISEVTGWGVMAFEMEICWCELPAGLLQYIGCRADRLCKVPGGLWASAACADPTASPWLRPARYRLLVRAISYISSST
jgi:hypothetical protein